MVAGSNAVRDTTRVQYIEGGIRSAKFGCAEVVLDQISDSGGKHNVRGRFVVDNPLGLAGVDSR